MTLQDHVYAFIVALHTLPIYYKLLIVLRTYIHRAVENIRTCRKHFCGETVSRVVTYILKV